MRIDIHTASGVNYPKVVPIAYFKRRRSRSFVRPGRSRPASIVANVID